MVRENRAKIRVSGNHDAIFCKRSCQNDVVVFGLYATRSDVHGIVTRRDQQLRRHWRQSVIDEESHAERGTGSSRSIIEAAANRRHSRMSST